MSDAELPLIPEVELEETSVPLVLLVTDVVRTVALVVIAVALVIIA